jgi:RNA polymerase sigma-70 factor, ECF subfamily
VTAEQVLIRRCQAGDDEAFGLLFEQYKSLVHRTTYLTLGSQADADDILQEVFLQVHRALGGYDPRRGSFSTWLYRITVNRCLNQRRGRPAALSLDEIACEDGTVPGVGAASHAAASPAERCATDDSVRRALDRLNPKLRVVVVLRHYWDLSYAEIAEIMDLPLGTVKSRLNTAMRQMRHDLESDFPWPARTVTEA